jgi:Ca-activated chloride channel homolog
MEWGYSGNLAWFWLIPILIWIFYFAYARKRFQLHRFGQAGLVERLVISLSHKRRLVKQILLLSAVACIILAMAQPHFRKKEKLIERRGIDLMVAVDVSLSMTARDVAPSRLEKAKRLFADLLEGLKGDRVGIVAFAGDGMIQSPLTLDKSAVRLFLVNINPDLISSMGTSLSKAIGTSIRAFPEGEKEHRALIIFSDGEDHEGGADAAINKAKEAGLRIYTVGIGTNEGSVIPGIKPGEAALRDRFGQIVISKLNEPLLRRIAQQTGGVYYRASRSQTEVENLIKDLSLITTKKLKKEWTIEYEESFQILLLAAVAMLLAEMILSERKKDE